MTTPLTIHLPGGRRVGLLAEEGFCRGNRASGCSDGTETSCGLPRLAKVGNQDAGVRQCHVLGRLEPHAKHGVWWDVSFAIQGGGGKEKKKKKKDNAGSRTMGQKKGKK